jgi:small conductance mechanosensitive channel
MYPFLLAQRESGELGFGFSQLVQTVQTLLLDKGPGMLFSGLAGLAILIVGLWVARLVSRLLGRVLIRAKLDETLAKFLGRLVHALLVAVTIMAALDRIGVNTTAFAAILAAAGLAIGLSLQGSLGNFAAGVMIILFRPFRVGDFVEAGGATGIVEEIHIFNTLMRSPDNIQVIVPNGSITGGNISNFSSKPIRRIDLVVGCGYGDNLRDVKQFLTDLVSQDPRILADPAPVVAVHELADNCVNLVVRPWVSNADYWDVRWDLTEAIKMGFDVHGFEIPFPQQSVHMHQVQPATISSISAPAQRSAPSSPAQVDLGISQYTTAAPPELALRSLIKPRRSA